MNQLAIATHKAKLALWAGRMQERSASGMSVKDWCQSQGISDKTYYYWFRKLKQEAFDELPLEKKEKLLQKSKTIFSEVKTSINKASSSDTAVSIYKKDIRIEIKNNAEINTVKMVFELLEQTC